MVFPLTIDIDIQTVVLIMAQGIKHLYPHVTCGEAVQGIAIWIQDMPTTLQGQVSLSLSDLPGSVPAFINALS